MADNDDNNLKRKPEEEHSTTNNNKVRKIETLQENSNNNTPMLILNGKQLNSEELSKIEQIIKLLKKDETILERLDLQYTSPPLDFFKDEFKWLELQLNVNIKQSFENQLDKSSPPTTTINNTISGLVGFYNRDEFKQSIQELVINNLNYFNKLTCINNSYKYGILINGSGNGKTRACHEIRNIILQMDLNNNNNNIKYRKLHSIFPFNGQYSLQNVEVRNYSSKEKDEGKIIGLRLLCSIINISVANLCNTLGTGVFNYIFTKTNLFTLKNVLQYLKQVLKKDEILIWSIAMDEIQNLTRWKFPLFSIGTYMASEINDNICLIPIMAGLQYENIKFEPNEKYGNYEIILPPIKPSNLQKILIDFFTNFNFKCKTSMIEMMKINTINEHTIQSMGIMLMEALLVPQVLKITLNGMLTILKEVTFQEWKEQSSCLFIEMQKLINEQMNLYLINDELFSNSEFINELLQRLLCGLPLKLTENEQDLMTRGKIYMTPSHRLYIAPSYFHKMFPNDFKPNNTSDFERIDLKCICYKLNYLKSIGRETISIDELFPSKYKNLNSI